MFRHQMMVFAIPQRLDLLGLLLAAWMTSPVANAESTTAVRTVDFLNSIGACVHIQHHQPAEKLVGPLLYTGIRNVRDGADGNFDVTGLLLLHTQAGVLVTLGPGSGAHDESLPKTITACRELAEANALLAIEGPNEPNNFGGVTYQGKNSINLKSWIPVANFQRDLYRAVKGDSVLRNYPVFGVSEVGAEDDNVGLQFLTVPSRAGTLMSDGTRYADFLNCHNYVCGQIKSLIDNQASLAASTRPHVAIDHLYGNHGLTWRKKFPGYTETDLNTLPKVTTETGWKSDNTPAGDDLQGKVLLNTFLAQYKAGWKYTFVYEFTDDPDGAFGFYKSDLKTPRKAARYLHNLTSILADTGTPAKLGSVDYSIPNPTPTTHDILMEKSDGTFELVLWGERSKGSDPITIKLSGISSMKIYDPTVGVDPIQTRDRLTSISLTLSDHVLILELKKDNAG